MPYFTAESVRYLGYFGACKKVLYIDVCRLGDCTYDHRCASSQSLAGGCDLGLWGEGV